jgi:tetratricopeptide (TPR) repeat protein/TolB-like protein/predicted Ser/Thr protein kinase
MIGKTVSHYKIIEKLGEGGMGEVYLAEDTELERKVALKFLPQRVASDPDALARFKREAQAAASLNHPNIITVHEIGSHDDRSFIAMAYIDGDLLSDEIKKGIPLERALDIAVQVCDGLDKAHRAGIVHRDIKPENLLIDRDGRVKILDFGLASSGAPGAQSTDDSTAGTVYYMSPEQVRGDEADARGDVFSLGAVLYEMLAGKRPFEGAHSEAVRYSIMNEEATPLSRHNPRVTPELERIVSKALAKDPADRYPSAALLATDLKSVAAGTGAKATRTAGARVSRKRLAIPGAVVLLAVVALLVVNPFKVNISPEQDAVAGENTVAIMYFENMAQQGDPRRLGEIITNLLITNLSQSQELKVVSSQRLYDILKQQGKEGAKVIDRTTATETARTAGARYMMLGSILQVEPHLIVTSQLVDVTTGNIESSQRLTGRPGETVFDIVDQMTGEARTELADPVELDVTQPRPVAEVTTNSIDAYRHYLEGLEYERRFYSVEACESFRKALEYDSTFAMAYLNLGWSSFSLRRLKDGIAAVNRAAQFRDRVSEKERMYIDSAKSITEGRYDAALATLAQITSIYPGEKQAYFEMAGTRYYMGDYENAVRDYRKVIELDPSHKESYNQMAYAYDHLGDFDKSIWAINQYIELAPGEPNPYDTRGDLYAYNGDIDNAIVSYRKALEIKPNFPRTAEKLGNMHVYKGEYVTAAQWYRRMTSSEQPNVNSRGEYCLAKIPLYRGKLREGISALDEAIAADEQNRRFDETYLHKIALRVIALGWSGQDAHAYEDARRFRETAVRAFPNASASFDLIYANMCVKLGRFAEADSIVGLYESVLDTLDQASLEPYQYAKGNLALARNDAASAVRHLEGASRLDPLDYLNRIHLARAYLMAGRSGDAIVLLEKMLSSYDEERLFNPVEGTRVYYVLGTAYQEAGRDDEAVEQYETFLEIWKDADAELVEVPDARRCLEELRKSI